MHRHIDLHPREDITDGRIRQHLFETQVDVVGIEHIVGIEKKQHLSFGLAHAFIARTTPKCAGARDDAPLNATAIARPGFDLDHMAAS